MPNTYTDLKIRILRKDDQSFRVDVTLNGEQQQLGKGSLAADALPGVSRADPVDDGQRLFNWLFTDTKLKKAWDIAKGTSVQRGVRFRVDAEVPELMLYPGNCCETPASL